MQANTLCTQSWAAIRLTSLFVNAKAAPQCPIILSTCCSAWQLQQRLTLSFTITRLFSVLSALTLLCLTVLSKPQFAFDSLHGKRFSARPSQSDETVADKIFKFPASIIYLAAPPPPLIFHSGHLFLSLPPASRYRPGCSI